MDGGMDGPTKFEGVPFFGSMNVLVKCQVVLNYSRINISLIYCICSTIWHNDNLPTFSHWGWSNRDSQEKCLVIFTIDSLSCIWEGLWNGEEGVYCDSSSQTRLSISVNTVNHRLADGNVNCSRGNNKTQRMLLFIDTRTITDKGRMGGACVFVCVCAFTLKSEESLEERGDGGFNVEYEFTSTLLCSLYISHPYLSKSLNSHPHTLNLCR